LLTIAGANFTLSEVVAKIKADPNSPWHREYLFYLLKIDGSGSTTFLTFADLLMNLAGYLMGEPKDDQKRLAVYRGPGPKGNCAMVLDPLLRSNVKPADIAAINSLMATGKVGNGVTNESAHNTDPETGSVRGNSVSVKEFYINGAEGRRATRRSENGKVTYYYSDSHVANTYKYQRLI
jgi:hypothetical protein